MTQLSPNTVAYDQLINRVSEFIIKYRENKFTNNKEFSEEYQNLLTFVNNNIGRTND